MNEQTLPNVELCDSHRERPVERRANNRKPMNLNRKAGWLFAAVTWFCINVNAQTNILTQPQISWALTNSMDGSLKDSNGNYIIKPWRVQLSAKISGEVVTNWTTTSIEYPTDRNQTVNGATTLLYIATGYHETGTIISNTVATIEWHGKQVPVVLETNESSHEPSTTTMRP